ncbi:MAG: hypothetical protein KGQ47_12980 [Hyphomicrobiales bacterium]|nr:hypothetical protein [Hyphomicrobiales bacterium]
MRKGLVRRFVTKLIQDMLPGALASLVGGFLLAHYGVSRPVEPAAMQAPAASVAMMSVLRDEHALVADFLKAETAGEKQRAQAAAQASTDEAVAAEPNRAAAESPVIAASRPQAAVAPVSGAATHGKAPVVVASLRPLVIAPPLGSEGAVPTTGRGSAFFTEVIKDRVVAATQRAVAAIGGIPSWFGAIGDRIGGESNVPRPPADLVSAS